MWVFGTKIKMLHPSIHMWALKNQNSVFLTQDRDDVIGYHFILSIQM